MADPIWKFKIGDTPLVATAIHDGHAVREEVAGWLILDEPERLLLS